MRYGKWAYGFQYHTEITWTTVAEWQVIPEYRASIEEALGRDGAAGMAQVVAARLSDFRAGAKRIDDNLQRLIEDVGRTRSLS